MTSGFRKFCVKVTYFTTFLHRYDKPLKFHTFLGFSPPHYLVDQGREIVHFWLQPFGKLERVFVDCITNRQSSAFPQVGYSGNLELTFSPQVAVANTSETLFFLEQSSFFLAKTKNNLCLRALVPASIHLLEKTSFFLKRGTSVSDSDR